MNVFYNDISNIHEDLWSNYLDSKHGGKDIRIFKSIDDSPPPMNCKQYQIKN